ncbi:hypothetical protein [Salipiger sp.]|uniref:hypothetical protein n=1 Tax=Salipiger sp. TaxID=2078585 RepID=UPI003A97653F
MSDLVFAADAETTMAIAPEIQERLLESLARFEIEAFERARAYAGPRSHEAATLELRREEALQKVLQQAIWHLDGEVARHPLRHVAAHLGLEISESDEDWTALAYEATKVLLDVSNSRCKRQQGIYEEPTVFFRRAVTTTEVPTAGHRKDPTAIGIPPATFASAAAIEVPVAPAPASFPDDYRVDVPEAPPAGEEPSMSDQTQDAPARDEPSAAVRSLYKSTALTPAIVPAGLDLPEGYDEESWQKARVAARSPRILVNRKLLSEGARAALEKQRGITLTEAIELYFELLSWGYRAPFNKHQKRKGTPEKLKAASVEER